MVHHGKRARRALRSGRTNRRDVLALSTPVLMVDLAVGQFPNYPAGNVDNTHLQEGGARLMGQMTLADLYRQRLPPGTLAKTVPQAP